MGCSASQPSTSEVSKNKDFHGTYKLSDKLGSGACGCVYKARLRDRQDPNCHTIYAAKILDKKSSEGPPASRVRKDFYFEVNMLAKVKDAKNVVGLIDAFEDARFCYVVMECCGPTVLEAFLETDANESDLAKVLNGMTLGVNHCHLANILHRDIKPQNFLISKGSQLTDKDCEVKLCDLGFAVEMPKPGAKGLTELCGTPPFMAPEMLKAEKPYDFKVDVWALGCSAYLLFFGTFPYNPDRPNADKMKQLIRDGTKKPPFKAAAGLEQPSEHACEFVRTMLERTPEKRPTAAKVLSMPYLQDSISDDMPEIAEEDSRTKEFFRNRQRMCSLASNFAKAAEKVKELQDERAISPKALKIFEEELQKLQEKTGLRREKSSHTMTLPSTPSGSIYQITEVDEPIGTSPYSTRTTPKSSLTSTVDTMNKTMDETGFARKASLDSQDSRSSKRCHTHPKDRISQGSQLGDVRAISAVDTEEGKLLTELRNKTNL